MADHILYFLSPGHNISPFDVNMAVDAGYSHVVPFSDVTMSDVVPLVQDSIFCRPSKRHNETGIFLGGRDVNLASDMFAMAKKAMVGDFEVAVFADPNGAYTTSAAILAMVEHAVKECTGSGLLKRRVSVFGPGPVGLCCAVLAAKQGAEVSLCQLIADDDKESANKFFRRYDVDVKWVSAQTDDEKIAIVKDTEVIISVARAGIRIIDADVMSHAEKLLVAADSNAVPPSGIVGVDPNDDCKLIHTANCEYLGIGALAIGNLKYQTEKSLFSLMQSSDKAAFLDFPEAFEQASGLLEQKLDKAA